MSKVMGLFSNFRIRKRVLAFADAFIVVVAGLFANFLLPLYATAIDRADQFAIFFLSIIMCFSALLFFGAYNKLWRYLNRYDFLSCAKGIFSGLIATHFFFYLVRGTLHWEFALVQACIASFGACLFRYMFRNTFISLVELGHRDALKKRTMIIGAGKATALLLNEIKNSSSDAEKGLATSVAARINPVCLIDDDRDKIGKPFEGVLVAGSTIDIPKIAKHEKIEQILFSIPSCPPKDRQTIMDVCGKTGLPVKVIPFVGSLLDTSQIGDGATSYATQIRDIKVEDLLGREPIKFDNKDIRAYIENKVCMVTGGGGSIGSELVRQIAKYNPKQIIIVDIYENNAYDIQQELVMEYGKSLNLVTLIASVRDYFRMNKIYKTYHPDVVFHAAAHKHVPLMETTFKNMKNLDTTLYFITDSTSVPAERFLPTVEAACKGGATLIQLREKNRSTREYMELATATHEVTKRYGIPLIIDDRVDVALAIGAEGVHVGQTDMPVAVARQLMGADKIIGATTKTVPQALEAYEQGADYLGVGAIYPTTTKVVTILTSVDTLKAIVKAVPIKVNAIGGLNKDNIDVLKGSGISGICAVSAIMKAADPERATRELKAATLQLLERSY